MADSSTRTPRPPRGPTSAGVRSIGSANDGNDLLLGAHRRNMATKKASSIAESESAKSGLQAEVDALKRQLHDSEKRLTTPVKASNRRARDSVQAQSLALQGERYNETPYKPVPQRIMWEPFESDPEVRAELDRLRESEQRISRRHEAWSHEWSRADRADRNAKIEAPVPAVFSARDDDAVLELAAKAEEFAATGRPSPKKDALATSRQETDRHVRTYSPPGAMSHSHSRAGSRAGSRAASRNRRTSSIHPASAHVLQSFGLRDGVDIVLPDPEEVVSDRSGDILGGEFVLKRDLFDAAFARKDVAGVMGGAPGFRMIPRFNIGAVSQAHLSGIKTILNEIAKQWDGPIVWVNLREEPIVYINNRSYIVRAASNPREPLATPGIKASRLEDLEEKLRNEVLREGQRFGGNVVVHKETSTEDIEAQWESVDETCVHSLATAFNATTASGYDVRYFRVPVTPHQGISRHQLDVLFDLCERYPSDPIIANCQTGRGRSTVAMVVCTIVRFYQHGLHKNDAGHTRHVSMLAREETAAGFRSLAQLVALLPNGHAHEQRVSMMCELTGKASNLVERIIAALKTEITPSGLGLLNRYCQLVAFSAYCEARLLDKSTDLSYSKWLVETSLVDDLLTTLESPDALDTLRSQTPGMDSSNRTDGPAGAKSTNRRVGEILLPGYGLVAMSSASAAVESVPGVEALRQVHMSVPIFSCGRSTAAGREALLFNACEQHIAAPRVDWLDVRSEPHVYINGGAYFIAATKNVFKHSENQMNVTGSAIEDIERRLKEDVLAELEASEGVIDVLLADISDRVVETVSVQVTEVLTPREHAAQFRGKCDKDIAYHRVPLATGSGFSVNSVHPLIDVAACSPTNSIVVIEDSNGGVGATVALNIFCLSRLAQISPLNSYGTADSITSALAVNEFAQPISINRCFGGKEEEESMRTTTIMKELMVAANLGQMLAAGGVLMATENVCDVCGRGAQWNLLDRCNINVNEMMANIGEVRATATRHALASATMYLFVYLAAVYVSEQKKTLRFEEWYRSLPEIGLLMDKMREHPKAGLKFVDPQNLFLDTDRGPVARRRGNVLTSNYGLKADHFPGAIRKNMVPQIPGVPNYRKVPDVNVYGVGIPTRRGVRNLLRVLGAEDAPIDLCGEDALDPEIVPTHARADLYHPGAPPTDPAPKGRVIWLNMREEPLLYVGDRPFVLRDLANPYVNVELTGITPSKIEAIEDALREDCLDDARKYNNQFLIHDEIKPGLMGGLWEPGTEDQITTIRAIYDQAVAEGARVTFVRLPVTDEQMPEIRDFDILVQALLPDIIASINYPDGEALSLVFNCQMGRGRTTTGMVVACMLIGLVNPQYYDTLKESYPELYPKDASKWANGHYSVINDLMRILVDGRDAKLRLDLVLEACDKMQNLRTAIEQFKDTYESPESSESARARAHHHGQHYLMRYFFLIVLNSYLHEAWDPSQQRLRCTFVDYMEPRDELRHFAGRCALK